MNQNALVGSVGGQEIARPAGSIRALQPEEYAMVGGGEGDAVIRAGNDRRVGNGCPVGAAQK